jgi:L-ascorbate metabolism protein UlaG (beta-lactamase superfamily)
MKNTSKNKQRIFENLSETPQLAKGVSMVSLMRDFLFRPKSIAPAAVFPKDKTNLKTFYSEKPAIVWFGHSSYLIHFSGINILVDPVLSGYASPFSFYITSFKGSDLYKQEDIPPVDILIITHNHYDHLDIEAIKALASQTKSYYVPLGVSTYLTNNGIDALKITEMDWWQSIKVSDSIQLTATPARHFSGRGLQRNRSLWASFVLRLNNYQIFIGSDSGYDTHFKEIGNKFGPFDLAILECGQYNIAWPYIHSMPEELIPEGADLKAKVLMPVHWGKFALAFHDWDEPINRFVVAADKAKINYTTPKIGEPVILDQSYPKEKWWNSNG